jgi:CSLREA domain-containing protein
MRHLVVASAVTLALLAADAAAASAATYTVTTTADTAVNDANCQPALCSLRQAITKAVDGDTVVLPASATPYLVSNGQLTVLRAITIEGAGAGSSVVEATAANHDRVMLITGNSSAVKLEDLTITGGDTTSTVKPSGGGIAAGGPGPVVMNGVDVVGNRVDTTNAGAGFNQGGGGIFSLTSLILAGSTVSDNTVNVPASDGDGGGGGILMAQTGDNSDNLTLTDSTVSDNTATVAPDGTGSTDANGGGGVYQDGGDLTVVGSQIDGNTAAVSMATPNTFTPTDGGGGIFEFGNQFLLQNSTVAGNVAHGPGIDKGGGGGILDSGNSSQYLNSTITANRTDEPAALDRSDGGGGVLLNNVKDGVTFANMTINANSASSATGGGINNNLQSTADVTDSIIAGNAAADTNGNCDGPITSDGYNLSDDSPAANTCSLTAAGDVVNVSPGLGPLADNGGPTATEALTAGSPAIDAGDPAGCTDLRGNPLATDQRGVSRPQPAAGRCDIGAYERALPAVLTGAARVIGTTVSFAATASNPDPGPGTVSFQYGSTSGYGATTAPQPLLGDASAVSFFATAFGLTPGTYHFRAVATNADGSSAGTDAVFTVAPPAPPVVSTRPAADVGPFSATLAGIVNPEGQVTTVRFEYGTTVRYGSRTRELSIAAGTRDVTVSAAISGLEPRRTYHVRAVAGSAAGTVRGSDVTFRTSNRPGPSAFNATVKPALKRRPPFVYQIAGRLSLPVGLAPAVGCRGSVRANVKVGRATVDSARTLVGRTCAYRVRVSVRGRRPGASGRARLAVRFEGNSALAPRSALSLVVHFG